MLDENKLAELKKGFGPRIKRLRMSKGLNQTALAKQIGVKSAAVTKYESQDNYPGVKGLIQLADFFEVSTDYLLFGEEQAATKKGIANSSSFVQSNIQANNGGIVVNGHILSPESLELLRIFDKLKVRERFELLSVAFDMEKKLEENVQKADENT